jgi:hypothetical protein
VSRAKLIKYSKLIVVIITALIFLHVLALPISNDYESYIEYLYTLQNSNLISLISLGRFEPLSVLTFWLMSKVFTPSTTLLVLGVILLYVKYLIFLEKLQRPMLAYVWYLITFAYLLEANQFRFAIASIFIIISLLSVKKKDSLTHLSMAVIGAGFHYSAVLSLIFFFALRPLTLIFFSLFLCFFMDFFFTQLWTIKPLQIWLSFTPNDQVSLTNPLFICQFFIGLLLLFYWRELSKTQKRGAILLIFGAIIYIVFSQNAIVAHRVRELSQLGIIGLVFVKSRWSSIPRQMTQLTAFIFSLYSIYDITRKLIN